MLRLPRFMAKFVSGESGSTMVEFALVAVVIFLPMTLGVIEVGRGVWIKSTLTAAAREGVRYAIVHGDQSGEIADSASVANYVINRTGLSGIVVRPSWPDGNKTFGSSVQVRVTYAYTPIVKLFPARTITSTSKQIISY